MAEVTQILSHLGGSDPVTAERLLPLVYDELRRLAAQKLHHEKPGQTLQATALVHEAYLRLVGSNDEGWDYSGSLLRRRGRGDAADPGRQRTTQAADPARRPAPADRFRRGLPGGSTALRGSPGSRRGPAETRSNRPAQGPARPAPLLCRSDDSTSRGAPGDLARHGRTVLGLCTRLAAPGDMPW